ncbi:hypothetical protein, partial [Elstera litoralis]|uniref:hypothetical protein n=1 Tax=Elstera litoralis TaxID=552518 RepID=UPI0018DB991E
HLFSVAVSLNPGGLYIIEAGHNDNNMNTTKSEWEIITDNSHIGVSWRDIRRYKYDRILTEATLRGFIREIKINNVDTFIRRAWRNHNITECIAKIKKLSLITQHHDFNFDDDISPGSWRNIIILRRNPE